MKKYFLFLLISLLTALIFEAIANTIGDGKLFSQPNRVQFFIVWYGFLYSLLYILFRNKPVYIAVIALAIIGPIAEVFVFHRLNILVDPIIYAIMAFVPFWLYKKLILAK